jgi:molecular chaperone DnaK
VETAGGVFTKLIDRNTTVPCRATEEFSTAIDNQDFVNVHVLQGEREMADDNKSLAHFQLVGIPPAPRGVPRIEVAFDIDANGILTVSAKDLGTGRVQSVNVVPTSGLDEDDIDRIINEAVQSADDDASRRELADARNKAEALLYTSDRALAEFGEVLSEAERDMLESDLAECRQMVEEGTLEEVLAAVDRLEMSAQRIGEIIYAQADLDEGEPTEPGADDVP